MLVMLVCLVPSCSYIFSSLIKADDGFTDNRTVDECLI